VLDLNKGEKMKEDNKRIECLIRMKQKQLDNELFENEEEADKLFQEIEKLQYLLYKKKLEE
jgi:hypothetical protein